MTSLLDPRLLEFLSPYRLTGGSQDRTTHVSFFPPQKYSIPDSAFEDFMLRLCDVVADGGKHSIAETPRSRMPVIADVKLLYDVFPEKGYTTPFLLSLIRLYQSIMLESLDIDPAMPLQLTCFVMEIDDEEEDYVHVGGTYEYRFRLHFPYCRVETSYFRTVLHPKLLVQLRARNMFQYLQRQPLNDWPDILNMHIEENPILMYGGIAKKTDKPLLVTSCYSTIPLAAIDDNTAHSLPLEENVFLDYYDGIATRTFSRDNFDDEDIDVGHWWPILFSLTFFGEVTIMKGAPPTANARRGRDFDEATHTTNPDARDEKVIQLIGDSGDGLLDLIDVRSRLNANKSGSHQYWLDIGRGIHHHLRGSAQGLKIWRGLPESHNIDIPDEWVDETDDMWEFWTEHTTDGITANTLKFYAYKDNHAKYREWADQGLYELYNQAASCSDNAVSEAFKERYPFEFLNAGGKGKDGWWIFENHGWVHDDEGLKLTNTLVNDFRLEIENHRARITNDSRAMQPGTEKAELEKILKSIGQLISKLEYESFTDKIIRALKRKYSNPRFYDLTDEQKYVTACRNCVIDIDGHRPFIRPGKPEDYCTLSTKVTFPKDDWEKHQRGEPISQRLQKRLDTFNKYIEQLFVDPAHPQDRSYLNFMACLRASYLKGGNDDKVWPIFFGESHTSKSQYVKCIFEAMGEYMMKAKKTLICFSNKQDGGEGPTPSISRSKGKRGVGFDELDSKTMIDTSTIRHWTGSDSQPTRDCFAGSKAMRDIKQQHTIFATMNKYSPVNDPSVEAFWERVCVCLFTARYLLPTPPEMVEVYRQHRQEALCQTPDGTVYIDAHKLRNNCKFVPPVEDQTLLRIYPRDGKFEENIPSLAPAVLFQMVVDYEAYSRAGGLPTCEIVRQESGRYQANADFYINFIHSALRQDGTSRITARQMYSHFKTWYGWKYPGCRLPTQPQFQMEMQIKHMPYHENDNAYHGYAIVSEAAEVARNS